MSRFHSWKSIASWALLPFYTTIRARTADESPGATRPQTIPALREWSPAPDSYTFSSTSRIVLDSACASELETTGRVLAEDLRALTGLEIALLSAPAGCPGDIVLTLNAAGSLPGREAYRLEVGECVIISATHDDGIFYGTRTLLQLLAQGFTIPGGVARDWPGYPERGLMVDVGRKYFSPAWLENHIRELAYLKYNYFQLHLSDSFGFRLESERHPEITSPQHYTKAEIRALIELARQYHIMIIPEIDMPGHMDAILASHPELQLVNDAGERRPGDIDLANAAAYNLMQDLLEEYLPLFPAPYWHIGADEYLFMQSYAHYPRLLDYARRRYGASANAKDAYLGFVNWANEIVKAHGKITRVWNDGLHGGSAVTIAPDLVHDHWLGHEKAPTPQQITDLNLQIVNSNFDYLYYVLRHDEHAGAWRARADAIYTAFEPSLFHAGHALPDFHPGNLGAKLHVWCDHPEVETEEQIAEGIELPLRALAQKNWSSPRLVADYEGFAQIAKRLGRAPGYRPPEP